MSRARVAFRIFHFSWLAAFGCSGPQEPAPADTLYRGAGVTLRSPVEGDPAPEASFLELGEVVPSVRMRAIHFGGTLELVSDEPLPPGLELEFCAFVHEGEPNAEELTTFSVDGDRSELLAATKPYPLPPPPRRGDRPYRILRHRERIDLARFAGRPVHLRFELGETDAPARGGLADFVVRPVSSSAPPPILLVCSDTHRFDFSLAGEGPALMPRLDRLKRNAAFYRTAWSNASWTLPSITSVLTGLYPRYHRTGLTVRTGRLDELDPASVPPGRFIAPWETIYHEMTAYPKELDTLPEILREHGYSTALVAANPFYFLSGLSADGHAIVVKASGQVGNVLNDAARRLLGRLPDDRPLFLSVHYMDVHDFTNAQFRMEFPGVSPYDAGREKIRRAYARAVADADRHLEELLRVWDEKIGLDRSLVIFYSDHGEHLFDPGHPDVDELLANRDPDLPEEYVRVSAPVLNHGNSMQESLLRIPLLLKYPRETGLAGRVIDAPVSLVDVLPTVLDLAGIEPPDATVSPQGRSLLSLDGEDPSFAGRAIFADYQFYGEPLASVRADGHKLVFRPAQGTYTLRASCDSCPADGDPGENVDDPELLAALRNRLAEHIRLADEATAHLDSDQRVPQDEVLQELRSLGYVR